jgi:hypothetical protein
MDKKLYEAMYNFQYLELMLREAVRTFETLIEFKMKGILHYPVDESAIDKLALGRLAERYAKYTKNNKFRADVEKVITARNRLAHRLFLSVEAYSDSLSDGIGEEVEAALADSNKAASLADDVIELMQHYYFDHQTQDWHFPGRSHL